MILSKFSEDSCEKTVEILKNGGVAVLPTDTVYGFSACVNKSKTDERIRIIKGRSETKPFIQLIAKPEDIFSYTNDIIPEKILSFWPGPLTIICKDSRFSETTTAFRCPGDAWLRSVIEKCESPLYSTSVNRSGNPVIVKIKDIIEEFSSETDLIVDAGDSESSIPSTIIKIEKGKTVVLREGAVAANLLN